MRDQGTPKDICGEAKLFSFPFERLPRRLGWTDHAGGRQVLFLVRMTHNITTSQHDKSTLRHCKASTPNTGSRGDVFVVKTSNPSKTSEKMGYFDRVTVSLHILCTANQETEGSQDRLTVTRHFMPRSPFGRRALRHRGYGLRLLIFKMANNKVDLGQIRSEGIVYSIYTTPQALSFKPYRV